MATHTFEAGTKIEVNGTVYTALHQTRLDDGLTDVVGAEGKIHTYNTEGQEVDKDGEVIKEGKSLKKKA